MSRPIIATCIKTNKSTKFDNVKEASKALGIDRGYITRVLREEYTRTKGYSFRYVTL